MAASGSREEKFLETFFPLISQFAFDKAKDLTVSFLAHLDKKTNELFSSLGVLCLLFL